MNSEGYGCIFSIIIAVYNCEPFLRETLESILNQDISGMFRYEGGRKTDLRLTLEELCEVIMVDDGSSDSSGAICDEYAEKFKNFKVIHKKNGGVASARNEGLLHVRGKYMNFLDSDDKFSPNVFSEIYNFFEENYERTDVVTMPLTFFDAVEGNHWQNYKFKKYARVVNLYNEYDSPLMFVNASFFKSEYKDSVHFCDKLVCGEDIRYICEILPNKMTMGLVPYCHYFYRRRSAGEESLVQTSKKKAGWYFDYFEHLTEWAVDFCNEKWGYMPYYYQNIIVCDLQWRFLNDYESTALSVLGEEDYERYKARLYSVLRYFDDKIILAQRNIWNEHKCMMMTKKHGALPERCIYPDDVRLRFGNSLFCWLSSCFTKFEFISVKSGFLSLEGVSVIFGYPEGTDFKIFFEKRETGKPVELIPCEITDRDASKFRLDERLYRGLAFKFSLPLEAVQSCKLRLVLFAEGEKIVKKNLRFGKFSPIGGEFKNAFYYSEGYTVSHESHFLTVKRASYVELRKKQKDFLAELRESKRLGAKKAAGVIRAVSLLKAIKRKPLILISDRVNRAGDNGEALFQHLCRRGIRDMNYVFAVEKSSPDYKRLKSVGRVVDSSGKIHKLLQLLADCVVSSHADELTTNPFGGHSAPYRYILNARKYVFLQHGVTKDDATEWLNRFNRSIDGLVCAAKSEADAFEAEAYHYTPENIWRTGFPRFDRLYENGKRYVTVMPTWRMYLSVWDKTHEGVWKTSNAFPQSGYFKFYNRLLNDEKLLSAARKYGYEICFMPHPNVSGGIELFEKHPSVTFFSPEKEYRDVFAESSLILTDYSSAVFDFAYLRKPIVYTQFDKDEFFAGSHAYTKGYFNYETDGFGEVAYDYDETVKLLTDYMSNGCLLKKIYRERIDRFFLYSDKGNSQRVYEKIREILH